jgi:hypothetical protein
MLFSERTIFPPNIPFYFFLFFLENAIDTAPVF